VGYSGSYLSAQHLLSDEIAQVALNVRKLISSGHPLLKTAKHLYSSENFVHIFGLTVLLVSRASSSRDVSKSPDLWNGILESQRSLAEIAELVYTSNFIHRGILNSEEMPESEVVKLTMGNKMAVLGGDLLLANASVALAKLRNPFVVNAIAQGIADMTLSLFVEGSTMKEVEKWERQVYLGAGSLLAHSCRSTVRLNGENESLENAAFDFGKHLTFVMALYYNSNIDASASEREFDWAKSRMLFPLLQVADQDARKLASSYSVVALEHLKSFPENEAKRSLVEIKGFFAFL